MPSNHLYEEPTWGSVAASTGQTFPDAAAIRRQLDQILANPHFRNSRRCQALLRHVVEAHLNGCLDHVKERTIGFEVFGRAVDYDTSHDSIVRTTAGEVRKRLAQYYQVPGHEHELRIVLPQGCYSPEFHVPPAIALIPPRLLPEAQVRFRRRVGFVPIVASIAVLIAVAVSALFHGLHPSELDRFWMPLLADRSDAVICVEQPLRIFKFTGPRTDELNEKMEGSPSIPPAPDDVKERSTVKLSELDPIGGWYFTHGVLMATARISELLGAKGKPFQILGDRNTSYHDLRGRPAILLGQLNNQWTLGLTTGLRYYLGKNAANRSYEVHDRRNSGKVIAFTPQSNRTEEFAIVSRILDVSTEKAVITATGATSFATIAAVDFLTHANYMQEAFRGAPSNWYRKNIEVVIKATVVGGSPGPPRAIATYFW